LHQSPALHPPQPRVRRGKRRRRSLPFRRKVLSVALPLPLARALPAVAGALLVAPAAKRCFPSWTLRAPSRRSPHLRRAAPPALLCHSRRCCTSASDFPRSVRTSRRSARRRPRAAMCCSSCPPAPANRSATSCPGSRGAAPPW
jgi:hypothetical protein